MTGRVIVVDQAAGWLLPANGEPIDRLVADASKITGAAPAHIAADIRAGIATLAYISLFTRPDQWTPPVPSVGRPLADNGRPVGATQAVLEQ